MEKRVKTPGSGRKKGSLNKRTQFNVEVALERLGIIPIEEILKDVHELEVSERVRTWLKIQDWLQPKPIVAVDTTVIENPELEEIPSEQILALVNASK